MRIFDCFIFNHEIELLEIRMNILNDYVDKFVITEGDITFSVNQKKVISLIIEKDFLSGKIKLFIIQLNFLIFLVLGTGRFIHVMLW